ncbi:MAG: hypothetical protein H3Z54_02230 [archaeon]|nr:hypothetical protein [archaeon]
MNAELFECDNPELVIEHLVEKKRTIDLSVALLKFRVLPLKPLEVLLEEEGEKQAILIAPRGKILTLPNGHKVFDPNALMEIKDYVSKGLRNVRRIQSDGLWAAIVGLSGVVGLMSASIASNLSLKKDKACVKRWIDERGNEVYLAKDQDGMMAHLLAVSFDRRYYMLYEPLVNALHKTGHYILRFIYPSTINSWHEALGQEMDPRIEVLVDPTV